MFLPGDAFDRATDFIGENGRALEVARCAVHFEEDAFDDLDAALSAHRNADGGFARGIEPDFYCEASSAADTVAGLAILSETGAPPDSELVQGAVRYLVESYEPKLRGWQKVPEEVNRYPHGEWWDFPDGEAASNAESLWALTNADVVGYLNDYSMLVPAEFLEMVTREAQKRLLALPDEMDMHSFGAFHRLTMRLGPEQRPRFVTKLGRAAMAIVERNPQKWTGYVASPLQLIATTASPLLHLMPFDVETNVDFEITQQQPDGSWRPRRRWQRDPSGWSEAEKTWTPLVTLRTLIQLDDFGRIAGR